ncbi:MAG: hypothetical protein RLY31_2917 [Bacteroidota bacterium]|jgi:hypothetical protein
MKTWRIGVNRLLVAGCLACLGSLAAQTGNGRWSELMREERSGVEALAMYPKDLREAILTASGDPVLLVRLDALQAERRENFRNLIASYPLETQELVWNSARYPGLVAELVRTEGMVTGDYPTALKTSAMESYPSHPDLFEALFRQQQAWDRSLDSLLEGAPTDRAWSVRLLMDHPEVLEIMQENLRMTVLSGDLYRHDPVWFLGQLDSLHAELSAARESERLDWQQSLEDNPAVKEEYAAAATAFQADYGYDDALFEGPDLSQTEDGEWSYWTTVYVAPYPYWLGYPYWYGFARWRPYPWWYYWGAYWRADQVLVIIDLPMPVFTYWLFHTPQHHRRYPHLSSQFVRHYYGHRSMGSPVVPVVDRWRKEHGDIISEDWMVAAGSDPGRFVSLGAFESERDEYNRSHPKQPMGRTAFLDKKARKYPDLVISREQLRTQDQGVTTRPTPPPPSAAPVRDKQPERVAPAAPREPSKGVPQTDRAKIYHRETLEQAKRQQPAVKPPPGPKSDIRSVKPAPKTVPKSKSSPPKPTKQQRTAPSSPSRKKNTAAGGR